MELEWTRFGQKIVENHKVAAAQSQEDMSEEARRELERQRQLHEANLHREPIDIVKELVRRKLIASTDAPRDETIVYQLNEDTDSGLKPELLLGIDRESVISGDVRTVRIGLGIKEPDNSHITQHHIATLETPNPRGKENFRVYFRPEGTPVTQRSVQVRDVTDEEYEFIKTAIYEVAELEKIVTLPKEFNPEETAS